MPKEIPLKPEGEKQINTVEELQREYPNLEVAWDPEDNIKFSSVTLTPIYRGLSKASAILGKESFANLKITLLPMGYDVLVDRFGIIIGLRASEQKIVDEIVAGVRAEKNPSQVAEQQPVVAESLGTVDMASEHKKRLKLVSELDKEFKTDIPYIRLESVQSPDQFESRVSHLREILLEIVRAHRIIIRLKLRDSGGSAKDGQGILCLDISEDSETIKQAILNYTASKEVK